MSLDLEGLRAAVAAHGRVVRVVVAGIQGSTPREAGASMLVWPAHPTGATAHGDPRRGQSGTIGGGALEWQATARAHRCTAPEVLRLPLGPTLGQCCGGAVTLVLEPFDAARLAALVVQAGWAARPLGPPDQAAPGQGPAAPGTGGTPGPAHVPAQVPASVARALARGGARRPQLVDGWLVEPISRPDRTLWVWGAGHVGRAIVAIAAPLPGLALTWVDIARDRFPDDPPAGVALRWAADPAGLVTRAPVTAEHLILTHDHALDLALCHGLLRHGFGLLGLIGSATKRARFHSRLAALGHGPDAIARIRCPIGDPALGKHPQAIALGVVTELVRGPRRDDARQPAGTN
ncbi:xanthine dehydrogenase accessory protein XdhC [Rhodobaculum claviforme]|uniref:Xanthine dehydrogenase accessory protein XdhC n=1 Tax=Rhodobaculum claviforme TaxID=1549854 RepID=A0A934TN05_9RHOB|nr:xanthine dehydrogenase accessory protein XdhC [Rhodobaculum claviforme]MBK5928810.1 xanthine dehydrogenase accessory protein XdhC [Rhodobaculum claviforme]